MSMAFQPVVDQVNSQFATSGRLGSGANQSAIASGLAPMAYKAQMDALRLAPNVQNLDAQQLAQVGGAREADAQAQLQADIDRFNFEQNVDDQRLANFLSLVKGGTVGSQSIQPVFRNQALSALGGALGGSQLGQLAGFNPAYGAILGGLLGYANSTVRPIDLLFQDEVRRSVEGAGMYPRATYGVIEPLTRSKPINITIDEGNVVGMPSGQTLPNNSLMNQSMTSGLLGNQLFDPKTFGLLGASAELLKQGGYSTTQKHLVKALEKQ